MRQIYSFVLAAGMLASGLATAGLSSATESSAPAFNCELRARSSGGAVDLTALASSASAASGNYRLVVAKRGDAGGADVEQSGSFTLAAGGTRTLSSVSMTLERGAIYDAKLVVTSRSGKFTCSRVLPSAL